MDTGRTSLRRETRIQPPHRPTSAPWTVVFADKIGAADRRLELLHSVLDGKVGRDTLDLLGQAVRVPRGRSLDVLAGQLAELAAERRQQTVAQVSAAAPLTAEQEDRLARVLSEIYRRTISVQVDVDPNVLGGS